MQLNFLSVAREQVPDATTLLKFRRLLEDNQLTQAIFKQVNAHLGQRGLLMREGTLVDATMNYPALPRRLLGPVSVGFSGVPSPFRAGPRSGTFVQTSA